MGLSFSNYNIKKSDTAQLESVLNAVKQQAMSLGYTTCEEADADVEAAVYAPEDNGQTWEISTASRSGKRTSPHGVAE